MTKLKNSNCDKPQHPHSSPRGSPLPATPLCAATPAASCEGLFLTLCLLRHPHHLFLGKTKPQRRTRPATGPAQDPYTAPQEEAHMPADRDKVPARDLASYWSSTGLQCDAANTACSRTWPPTDPAQHPYTAPRGSPPPSTTSTWSRGRTARPGP